MSERFLILRGGVLGRDKGNVQFFLDHPHVSRRHASIVVLQGGRPMIADLGSGTGTFVNGKRIVRPMELKDGDLVQIGPFSLHFDGQELVSRSRSNNLELSVRNVRRVVTNRASGQPVILLDDVSLVVKPREFACLLGPSGAGKSTLLGMISGRVLPDRGSVAINGQDLHHLFASLKQDIAVVAQRDAMHQGLTIGRSLRYTAQLRLPRDTSREEIDRSVDETLRVVGLEDKKHTALRHLSGGQIKRAGLANELIARPSLLLIDEATTGLDELTDRDMMELFRRIADAGKTVVCVTHNLSNIEPVANLLIILTEGGKLGFIGTPAEAKVYFGVARLGDIYRKLALFPAEQWQNAYQTSPLYTRYVLQRLPKTADIARPPKEVETDRVEPPFFSQTKVLIRRSLAIWNSDRPALFTMLGQSLVLALLLVLLFGNVSAIEELTEHARQTINLLFVLNVACFWFGCNNAVKEFVKERVIYQRERFFNLRIDSYFVSKLIVLSLLAVAQATIFFTVVRVFCDPEGMPLAQWFVLALMAIAGTTLGLLISALARTEEMAIALVPLAVVPQIVFAGVITPLSGASKILARAFIASCWAEGALESLLSEDMLIGLRPESNQSYHEVWMVAAHAVLFGALALTVLKCRDERARKE